MKFNIFAQHPAGFRIHFEGDDSRIAAEEGGAVVTSKEVLNRLLANMDILTKHLADHGYTGEYPAQAAANGSAAPSAATGASTPPDAPACDVCKGPMEWKTGVSGPRSQNPGMPWKGWFCLNTKTAPRANQHPAVFVHD